MSTIERLHTNQRMSQTVVHNDTIYLAGQVAADPSGGVADQTRQVLAQIDALLADVGSDKAQILMATIWLSDISTFADMNAAWDAWVPAGHTPARACVESRLAGEAWKVEIRVVAARA